MPMLCNLRKIMASVFSHAMPVSIDNLSLPTSRNRKAIGTAFNHVEPVVSESHVSVQASRQRNIRATAFSDAKPVITKDYLSLHASRNRLEGKVALITGGASGIGEATAKVFAAEGAKVVIADIQDWKNTADDSIEYLKCDVSREDDISDAVDFAVSKHGALDIIFNNAGISNLGIGPVSCLNIQDFDRVMAINVRGVLLGVKHAARVMIPAGKGCILCTASINGVVATGMNHPYTISKHAVPGIVKSAAAELGRYGIRVNCISPYVIPTPMVVQVFKQYFNPETTAELVSEKVAEPNSTLKGVKLCAEDIARAALFLSSEDGRFINGHNLVIDGGFTISKDISVSFD